MIGESDNIQDKKYSRYHDLMKIVAKNNDLEYDKDIRPLTAGGQNPMMEYLVEH